LPDPHVIAAEIADDLRASLEQIEDVLADLQEWAKKVSLAWPCNRATVSGSSGKELARLCRSKFTFECPKGKSPVGESKNW